MKLIHYTLRNLSIPLFLILGVWAYSFYKIIMHEINDETNATLRNYKNIIIKAVLADSTKLNSKPQLFSGYRIREISKEEADLSKDELYDSVNYIEFRRSFEPVRVLKTHFRTDNGKYYELMIQISTVEKEDLAQAILVSVFSLYLALLICILIVIHIAFKRSFRPLYKLLDWLKKFHPGKKILPLHNETNIEEFRTLNEVIEDTSNRNIEAYNRQKQFVENAAHELQTPLAICMNKIELLSDHPEMNEEQLEEIADVQRILQRLIRTNKSLLLLSRIENKQFPETKLVKINYVVKNITTDLSNMYQHKELKISIKEKNKLTYQMNESLAFGLIGNLLSNAFVYTPPKGEINIYITRNKLIIENTSEKESLEKERLFDRFIKYGDNENSTGLGLAVSKSITQLYKIQINYTYNGKHQFILTFPTP